MTKKLLALILVLLYLLGQPIPAQAGKTYRAERFDIQLDLLPNGEVLVTETVTFHFEGGPFTYVFRNLSPTNTDGITFIEAGLNNNPLPQGTQAGQVEIENGDPLKITWHFAPISNQTQTFSLRYRIAGLVRTGAADTLIRDVIPSEHDYRIETVNIFLNYPQGVRPLEEPTINQTFNSAPTDTGTRLTTADIAVDERVTLAASFPAKSLTQTTPQWQAREQVEAAAAARALPIGLFSGLATLLLGGLGLFTYIRVNQRDLALPAQNILTIPPADLPPAVVGKLLGMSNNTTGTLFDLAQRGLFSIREEKGSWGTTNYLLERTSANSNTQLHENILLDLAFKPGETQANLSEIGSQIISSGSFDQSLDNELIQRGWLDPQRKEKRMSLVAVGFLALLGSMGLFIVGAIGVGVTLTGQSIIAALSAILAGVGLGAFALSIPLLIYAGTYSPLTPAGEEQKIRWNSFRAYLDQVSQGSETTLQSDTFERYLALATIFGLGAAWAKHFQTLNGIPLPAWFHSLAGSDGDMSAMLSVMTAVDNASYSSGVDGSAGGGDSSGAG